MPTVAPRLGLAIIATWLVTAGAACQGPDPFYRHLGPDGGAGTPSGHAGTTGAAGTAVHTGAAGTMAAAGTTGAAGTSAAGTSAAGKTGAAGTSAAGSGTMTGAAGAGGAAGTAGAAGTSGAAGNGTMTGAAGTSAPCTTCKVKVQYTCRSDQTEMQTISFVLDVTNESTIAIPLVDLTLRYWYTLDGAKAQELNCDYAKLGCTNLVTSADQTPPMPKFQAVMPPKPSANEYVEIAFKASALTLDPFLDTGEIQLRLHNVDFSTIKQIDDYSFDCSMKGNAVESTKITAYVKGVLVWGTEPQ